TYQSLVLHVSQMKQPVEPSRVVVRPGMELEKVEPVGLQPGTGQVYGGQRICARSRPGFRHPLGKRLDLTAASGSVVAGYQLRGTVVIGHVEGREPCADVAFHGAGADLRIDGRPAALDVGHLPQSGEHAADLEPWRQCQTLGN